MKFGTLFLIGFAALVFVAACGDDDDTSQDGPSSAVGPGISIEDALTSDLSGPLLVNGYLVARDGEVRLCSALAESFPPQCAGNSLKVEGLDLSGIVDLRIEQGVSWTDDQRQILGDLDGEVIRVSQTST